MVRDAPVLFLYQEISSQSLCLYADNWFILLEWYTSSDPEYDRTHAYQEHRYREPRVHSRTERYEKSREISLEYLVRIVTGSKELQMLRYADRYHDDSLSRRYE